ncbi:MAG: hypothetical protein M1826_006679 [Phylliscum demangeonii]|nr:MAG: hypothetical protein M1826_006679 [Phylliscum demangeonii]
MATRAEDQQLVERVADDLGVKDHAFMTSRDSVERVVPCFGWHPWFSHQLYDDTQPPNPEERSTKFKQNHYRTVLVPKPDDLDFLDALPDPRPLSEVLGHIMDCLKKYPLALVGEIGLDKSFRLPEAWAPDVAVARDPSLTPGGRDGRRLSPYRVSMEHQKIILKAQLHLAGQMGRAVSVHGVQAHGVVVEVLQESWKGYEKTLPERMSMKKVVILSMRKRAAAERRKRQEIKSQSHFPREYACIHIQVHRNR